MSLTFDDLKRLEPELEQLITDVFPESNQTSSIKRSRRTRDNMDVLRFGLYKIVAASHPATVRQVFYQATTRGLVDKTEKEYRQTVCRLLAEMRLSGQIPFDWIADNTKSMRKPRSFGSLQAALEHTRQFYRRSLWENQETYLEVWCEKDALTGVLYEITAEWDVPLMVTRGYASLTFLHAAAEAIAKTGKPAQIYYFGDWDPSGVGIASQVEEKLRKFGAEIDFRRVAVTPEQIRKWNLPTRPTKKTDSRSKGFKGDSVELDAIPPDDLRALVRDCITRHVDETALAVTQAAEASERDIMTRVQGLAVECSVAEEIKTKRPWRQGGG